MLQLNITGPFSPDILDYVELADMANSATNSRTCDFLPLAGCSPLVCVGMCVYVRACVRACVRVHVCLQGLNGEDGKSGVPGPKGSKGVLGSNGLAGNQGSSVSLRFDLLKIGVIFS